MLRHVARSVGSRSITAVLATVVAIALALGLALPALAAEPGPPFPDPVDGQAVYDTAGLFSQETRDQADLIIHAIESQSKAEVVVYTQALGRDHITTEEAESHARALLDPWGGGRDRGKDRPAALYQ